MVNHDPDYIAEIAAACKKAGVRSHGIGSHALQITMQTWAKFQPAPIVAAEFARRVDRMDALEPDQVNAVVADLRLEDPVKTQAPTNALLARFRKATETDAPRRLEDRREGSDDDAAETRPDAELIRSLRTQAEWCDSIRRPDLARRCRRRAEWIGNGRPGRGPADATRSTAEPETSLGSPEHENATDRA